MGMGNVCTFGKAEGLYFVDNDFLDVYSKLVDAENNVYDCRSLRDVDEDGYEYDEVESQWKMDEFRYEFCEAMRRRFPSFEFVDKWISNTRLALLENDLCDDVGGGNQRSMAIELIQKEGEYGGEEKVGLQMGLYRKYLKGIEEILLDLNGEVGTYKGAWTSGVLYKITEGSYNVRRYGSHSLVWW